MGLAESNPVIGSIQPKDCEIGTHVLTDAEIATVWRACGNDDFGRVVKLLLLTGARKKEIGGLSWAELDTDNGTWTLPAERAKNGRAHTLPLPPMAWSIIEEVPHRASRDHLFGIWSKDGFSNWDAKDAFDKSLGDTVRPFDLHDLRRTVATGMADIGVQPHVIEQILNHVSGHRAGVAGIYNRSSYEREVRAALALWTDHVRTLVDGSARKVLLMPQGASAT
jgi:integrase